MTDQAEQIAIALWHRFAPEGHMEWSEETHQAEYRDAADAVLLFTRIQPNRLLKLAEGCRTKADLYRQAHPEIPASFRVIADELDRIARTIPGITSASETVIRSSDGEPSNGKQPLMASRPAPPSEPAPGTPLWRIALLCEQHDLYTKDELVGLIQKVAHDPKGYLVRCSTCHKIIPKEVSLQPMSNGNRLPDLPQRGQD